MKTIKVKTQKTMNSKEKKIVAIEMMHKTLKLHQKI